MNGLSRYWQIYHLSLVSNRGYEVSEIATAREFYEELANREPQIQTEVIAILLAQFKANSPQAGLCLRCYISSPILRACQKLAALFSSNYNFSYRDLLPFVLDDDGQRNIVLAKDGKTQLLINCEGNSQTSQYKFFSIEILTTYKTSNSSLNLDNWTFLQTKQHPEIKKYLAEFGFQNFSDWSLLNRVGVKQIAQLAPEDRHLVEVFHAVYRRDRRQRKAKKVGKCPNPTEIQLTEMQALLRDHNCIYPNLKAVFSALKKVANLIRQYDIWSYREPLEVYEPDTGNYTPRQDLYANDSNNAIAAEEQELLDFIRQSLDLALDSAISQTGTNRLEKLNKSKKYRPFAAKFIEGLQLYYCQKMSLREITDRLEFGSWDRARRILNPGDFLNAVRANTIQQLLNTILEKSRDLGLSEVAVNPDYLQNLSIQIEAFADETIFSAATAEMKAGKNRELKSLYAQKIRLYCQQYSNNQP
ncbi:MAG: hypothetical protein AAF652_07140 [Cyanobacteria bacterium P01_C01_bin.72]